MATTAVLNGKIGEVENKIPNASGLVKKTVYEAKISEIDRKYFTTSGYHKFMGNILHAKVKQNELVDKADLNAKLVTLATKVELKAVQDKIMKLES